jgi:hypothetical protein
MSDQSLLNMLFGMLFTAAGWWLKALWDSVKELQQADKALAEKVATIEVLVAGNYVTRADFDRFLDGLFKKLDRIEDKLDGKVDK